MLVEKGRIMRDHGRIVIEPASRAMSFSGDRRSPMARVSRIPSPAVSALIRSVPIRAMSSSVATLSLIVSI
jgi:hypothetical protein